MIPRLETELNAQHRRILCLLTERGSVVRGDLIKALDTSPQTVMRLVGAMSDQRLVTETVLPATGPGKPAYGLSYAKGTLAALGLAISRRSIGYTLSDLDGQVIASGTLDGAFEDIRLVQETVAMLMGDIEAAIPQGCRVVGLGGALQGYFIETGRRIISVGAPRGWAELDLVAWLGGLTGLPLMLANDARILAASLIPTLPSKNFFSIWLGSGIGGGLVLGGALQTGAYGNAGEIGAIISDRAARPNEENFRAAAGLRSWDAWAGLDVLPPKDRHRLEDWAELAAIELSHGLNAVVALTDVDHVVISSRMPSDLMTWFTDQVTWALPGQNFVRGPADAGLQLPPPTLTVHSPAPLSQLAAQVAIQTFLTHGFSKGSA